MRLVESLQDIAIESNFMAFLRERGKIVPGSHREGHNVFTITGRNLLSKLLAWQTLGATDVPYTRRRVRWIGVGTGSQLEVTTVSALAQPHLVNSTNYLVTLATPEFPTTTSVEFIREFASSEISPSGPVVVTEAGLFADVNPAAGAPEEDEPVDAGVRDTTLDPTFSSNAPIAYHAFEGLAKTPDFTLELRWELRF